MTSREKVLAIFNRKGTGEGAMWTGHPNEATVPIYADAWHIEPTREAIFSYLNDDCRWLDADDGYQHPSGRRAIDPAYYGVERPTLSAPGCFADAETVADIEKYPWPDPADCDFTEIYRQIARFPDKMVFTGMWSQFFHDAADVLFFGNDFGTQRDLFLSPELFRRFVLPSFKRLIAVGKKYNKKIMLHSCGSIARIIPDLIDAGVDILHPIQAQAAGMSARELAQYKNDLAFVGGIDAQSFFVQATPAQIRDEVHRVRDIPGPNIVISPSHEEVLPNVPPENILAMAEAARD